jgi:hypothetical protein
MYQLWDADSANLVGSYATEETALVVVRNAVDKHGREVLDPIVLLHEGPAGLTTIAEGAALVDLALARTSPAA